MAKPYRIIVSSSCQLIIQKFPIFFCTNYLYSWILRTNIIFSNRAISPIWESNTWYWQRMELMSWRLAQIFWDAIHHKLPWEYYVIWIRWRPLGTYLHGHSSTSWKGRKSWSPTSTQDFASFKCCRKGFVFQRFERHNLWCKTTISRVPSVWETRDRIISLRRVHTSIRNMGVSRRDPTLETWRRESPEVAILPAFRLDGRDEDPIVVVKRFSF